MALERELATYSKHLDAMKSHTGKFVLIHGDDVIDFYSAYEDALRAGYRKFSLEPFLVKQVNSTEAVQYITRRVLPAELSGAA